jgi:hypothetical protein
MKNKVTFFVLFFLALPLFVRAQQFEWARTTKAYDHFTTHTVSTDHSRNAYLVGTFKGTVVFDTFTFVSKATEEFFLVKYDRTGKVIWAQNVSGLSNAAITSPSIISDEKGDPIFCFKFTGNITIGDRPYVGGTGAMLFCKYDTNGAPIWVRPMTIGTSFTSMACDSNGNLFFSGSFTSGSITFGNFTLTNAGGSDGYVVKFDTSGNAIWAKNISSSASDLMTKAIACDHLDNVYVLGQFKGTYSTGSFSITSSGDYDIFLTRFDAGGTNFWVSKGGSTGLDQAVDLAATPTGTCYYIGKYAANMTVDSISFPFKGGAYPQYLAKYNAGGHVEWVARDSSWIAGNNTSALTVNGGGDAYFISQFNSIRNFPGTALAPTSTNDLFIACYASNKTLRFVKQTKGNPLSSLTLPSIAMGRDTEAFISALIHDTVRFDLHTAAGSTTAATSIVLAKLGNTKIITENSPSRSVCAGTVVNISYTATGLFEGDNTFVMETSDSNGSFAKPVQSPIYPGSDPFTYYSTLPLDLPSGSHYRFRVASTNPYTAGNNNGADIKIFAAPKVTFSPSNIVKVCAFTDPITITASGGTVYHWSSGESTSFIVATHPGTYYVTAENQNACQRTDSVVILEVPVTASIITSKPTEFCEHDTNTLSASGGDFYKWSNGDSSSAIKVTTGGWYKVTVKNTTGCTDEDSVFLTVKPAPVIAIVPQGIAHICPGDSVMLHALGGVAYIWSNGAVGDSIRVGDAGNYFVYGVGANECTGKSSSIEVKLYPAPAKPVIKRAGADLTVTSSDSVQWFYNGGAISGATTTSITPDKEGTYSVIVTNADGCSSRSDDYHYTFSGVHDVTLQASFDAYYDISSRSVILSANIPQTEFVKIEAYSVLGELVQTLASGTLDAGKHQFTFAPKDAGVYFIRCETRNERVTRKVMLSEP